MRSALRRSRWWRWGTRPPGWCGQAWWRRAEAGSGSALAIAATAVVALLLVAGVVLAGALVAGQRARSAADLAALGGAGSALEGDPAGACAAARRVALANNASLLDCWVEDGSPPVVEVRVSVSWSAPGRWPGMPSGAQARARAGAVPVDER